MCALGLFTILVLLANSESSDARVAPADCEVRAHTSGGWVCGSRRIDDNGGVYASFRGVPYAKQPLGELRFKELQPPTPWNEDLDAREDGPICPQQDVFYKSLMTHRVTSEACIHANIHVPIEALPDATKNTVKRQIQSPYQARFPTDEQSKRGLPILVFIHGGGFGFGSGASDVYGPEYLVSQEVIVITFNYRLGAFGFLSLNSSSIPGNNGLRDMVTLLKWVKANALAFGGDPDNVTLGGHSAGASSAHLLSLSEAATGLFKRIWLMSGTGTRSFFNASPLYMRYMVSMFMARMGINSTDPEEIHQRLVNAPLEDIMNATIYLQDIIGINGLGPVVESSFPGVTTIVDDDPEVLVGKGRGKSIPIVIGFTNAECESFRPRLGEINFASQLVQNPLTMVPQNMLFKMTNENSLTVSEKVEKEYNITKRENLEGFIDFCSDVYFMYPSMKMAEWRAKQQDAAPLYLYEFSYNADYSVLKEAFHLNNKGAVHMEDMTYIFKIKSLTETKLSSKDILMRKWMIKFFSNFIKCSSPTCNVNHTPGWPAVSTNECLKYQRIEKPTCYEFTKLTTLQNDTVNFFDSITKDYLPQPSIIDNNVKGSEEQLSVSS